MNLVGYTATALSRNDIIDTPTNKNVVDFAIVELKDLQGNLVVMYDDAEGANPETQKTCDTNGQVTFFAEAGDYVLEVNGRPQKITISVNITVVNDVLSQRIWGDRYKGELTADAGVTLTDEFSVMLYSGNYYSYTGSDPFPLIVAAGTVPAAPDYELKNPSEAGSAKNNNGGNLQEYINTNPSSYSSVSEMKTSLSVPQSAIDNYDITANTKSYYGGWDETKTPDGGAEYLLTTKQRVRDSKGDPLWEPDGLGDHYLYGGTDYVAVLQKEVIYPEQYGAGSGASVAQVTAALNRCAELLSEYPNEWKGHYTIDGVINLPDANQWALKTSRICKITQQTDDTPIFKMTVSKFRFGFEVGDFKFNWTNNQPSANVNSIGLAFSTTVDNPDGIFNFKVGTLVNENGYRCMAVHPDSSAFKLPLWGMNIDSLQGQSQSSGAVFAVNTPQPSGAPRTTIKDFYSNASSATEPTLDVRIHHSLRIENAEFNNGSGRLALIQSSRNCVIGTLRIENSTLDAGEDFIAVSGANCSLNVDVLEFDSCSTASASNVYGIKADAGGTVNITGRINTHDITSTGGGVFSLLRPNSVAIDRFLIPSNTTIDIADSNTRLYLNRDSKAISFSNSTPIGSFFGESIPATVAGKALFIGTDGAGIYDYICPSDGYIVAAYAYWTTAVTGGTSTFRVKVNGADIGGGGFNVAISSGQSASSFNTFINEPPVVNQTHKVSMGDRIRVTVTTSSLVGGGNCSVSLLMANSIR